MTRIAEVDEFEQDAFRMNILDSSSFEGGVDVRELNTSISSHAKTEITVVLKKP